MTDDTQPPLAPPRMSPTIAKLAAALAQAQGQIAIAHYDRENPHFKARYATLAAVWGACRGPLAAAGLAVVQLPELTERKTMVLTTMLIHASGEWVTSDLELPLAQVTPQGIGSALTYGRRYALAALVGVATAEEDDDGEATATRTTGQHSGARLTSAPTPSPAPMQDRLEWAARQASSPGERPEPTRVIDAEGLAWIEADGQRRPDWHARMASASDADELRKVAMAVGHDASLSEAQQEGLRAAYVAARRKFT